jgi:hypothetical protein
LLVGALVGCGEQSESVPPPANNGGGGGAGGASACPAGSHLAEDGSCAATLGAFNETSALHHPRDHHVTWAMTRPGGKFIFALGGGHDMEMAVGEIERARINDDGSLGAWEILAARKTLMGPMVATTESRVLIAAGLTTSGIKTATYVASVNDAGDLGELETGPSLHVERFHGAALRVGDWVYASGGLDGTGTSSDSVERLRFTEADGASGEWIVDASMPEQRSHHGLAASDDALYVTGGLTRIDNQFDMDEAHPTVIRAAINDDGSLQEWKQVATLPLPLAVHASFVHVGFLYLVTGLDLDKSDFLRTIRRAAILEDGSLGAWEEVGEVPMDRGHCHQTPMVNGFLYSVAGTSTYGSQTNVFVARFE